MPPKQASTLITDITNLLLCSKSEQPFMETLRMQYMDDMSNYFSKQLNQNIKHLINLKYKVLKILQN